MYLYETHLHTSPVSRCARATVRETLEFYKSAGYDGVFITNHFIDGNINCDRSLSYKDKLKFYFSDYEDGVHIGKEIGISVFLGIESSYSGTDFLIYGLSPEWYFDHPEIEKLERSDMLSLMADAGALVIQAHPFREASYINHIRLFPRNVHGVEIYNACCSDFQNEMAKHYAKSYGLIEFAGSDNHLGGRKEFLCGMKSAFKISSEKDFAERVKQRELASFCLKISE